MESSISKSELPTLNGTDHSEQEAFDPEATPFATPRDNDGNQEINKPLEVSVASQPVKSFVPPTSFYAKPPEKEKRKPL